MPNHEPNPEFDPTTYHHERFAQEGGIEDVYWTTPGLRVTRLRLLSDPGFPWWDVSYCHGVLDGRHVRALLPFDQLPKGGVSGTIVQWGKVDGVYARGLGILDCISTLS